LEKPYPYLILDFRYEKVREEGAVRSQAVLVAIGINWEGGAGTYWRLSWRIEKALQAGRNC
jgi:Transposase, Mutator family